jgi:hypothetical protein
MLDPNETAEQRASNRELMWLLVGAFIAGSMIAVATYLGGGLGG